MVKRSEAEWQSLFEQQTASGLSAAAFCREHGLCPKYFSLRRKQLQRQTKQSPGVGNTSTAKRATFIPAVMTTSSLSSDLLLQTGNIRLTLPLSVDSDWLARFIRTLQD